MLETKLHELSRGDRGCGQLNATLLAVQHLLCPSLHGDDPGESGNVELEVGITGDGHELDIGRPPQNDVVRAEEVDYFERKHFGAVVARVSEGDRQGNSAKGDRLLTWDHAIEWLWAALELVLGESQSLKGVEVHEVEATTHIHEYFGQLGHSDQRVNDKGKPP
jgi:hypothetical protein